jgi:hypothetical protein
MSLRTRISSSLTQVHARRAVIATQDDINIGVHSKTTTQRVLHRRHSISATSRRHSSVKHSAKPFKSLKYLESKTSLTPTQSVTKQAVTSLAGTIRMPVARLSTNSDKIAPPLVIPPMFQLQPFVKKEARPANLEKKAVSYSGTITVGAKNVSLVPNQQIAKQVIQFAHSDVLHFEDVVTLSDPAGRSVPITRLWVKKGAKGVVVSSFVVGESRLT